MRAARVGSDLGQHINLPTADTFDETADLDYIAIERAINGETIRLTADEKLYAARVLDSRGMEPSAIAYRIRSTGPIVEGWKANGWKRGAPIPPRQTRPEPVCGEARMYRRHLKRGERCEICRAANAAADRRYRATGSKIPAEVAA